MFGRMMNSFYYGKSGKGDFRKEDLPKNRWQLFRDMLRVRFAALFRLNLMTVVVFLPLIFVIAQSSMSLISAWNTAYNYDVAVSENADLSEFTEDEMSLFAEYTTEDGTFERARYSNELLQYVAFQMCLWLIPCILITGPIQAGMAYVTRNWARDEHAFIWADFKDAVKENWKQALGVSAISSVVPIMMYVCWSFYGQMTANSAFFVVPQVLTLTLGLVWGMSVTFMYPVMVSYRMKFTQVIKNSVMLSIARLPQTIGIRLITMSLILISGLLLFFTNVGMYALLILAGYYLLLGFAMTRFVIASYTNAVFDKYINSHIEGAKVNRGLSNEEDDEDDEDDAETAAASPDDTQKGNAPSA